MNFKITAKLIFTTCCLLPIFLTQYSHFSLALAENLALKATDSYQLSQPEKSALKQGKVILKGQKGDYLGQVIATGNLDNAWEVLTDYNNFAKFLPNIASSKIISQQGDRIIFEQVNVVDLWLFKQEFEVQIEAIKNKPTQVDFQIVDGDLKKLIGRWQIEETSPGKILVSHAVEVEPGSDTEKAFFYGVYESSLE
ncbi:MAG: SRPBCC family protein, partial [Pleurocapsa sp. MO_226.B13]|nr:SRPBCC family protein [Pleurocapsa sp. MO_226.B13]